MTSIAWLTDIHLNFLEPDALQRFLGELRECPADTILLGGDIGEAPDVCDYLRQLDEALARPVYFVLGNHDFYRGSIQTVRRNVTELVFFVRDRVIEKARLADLFGGCRQPFSHFRFRIHPAYFKVFPEHIERRWNNEYQKCFRDQIAKPFCTLDVNPHYDVIALRQGIAYLFFWHTVVVVVHLRPFQQFVGRNHVDEVGDRYEMGIDAVSLSRPGIARGGCNREMEAELA